MEERENGSIKKFRKGQSLRRPAQESPTLQKSTVVQNVPNLTRAHQWRLALLLPRKALWVVDRQRVKVTKTAAQHLSAHAVLTVTLPLHVNGVTTARTLDSQVAHVVVPRAEEIVIIGVLEVKHLVVGHIQVALSGPRPEAVLTVAAATATRTAIVTTAMESITAGEKDGLQTLNMRGEVVGGHTDGITPPRLQKKSLVRVHALAAAESTIDGGVNAAAAAVTVVAAGAAVRAHTDTAATAAVAALPVARPAPPKARLTGMVTTDGLTVLQIDAILIALVSTDHSLRGLPRPVRSHGAATRHKQLKEVEEEEALQSIGTHSQHDSFSKKSSLGRAVKILELEANQAPKLRTLHRATSGPDSPLYLETRICCPCLVSCKQGRNLHYFLYCERMMEKSQGLERVLIQVMR